MVRCGIPIHVGLKQTQQIRFFAGVFIECRGTLCAAEPQDRKFLSTTVLKISWVM